jgi:hypothetical protein
MSAVLRLLALPLLASLLLAGCQPVREDRTITFAGDGAQVAVQHGREGVFIAETEDGPPRKIFQPDPDVIATSVPLWSPTDKRLIFTTATPANKERGPAGQDPAGNVYTQQPTLYTCWLRTEPKPGQPLVVPLFTVPCDHPGYVAANLAVRWHPDGQHVLFVQQTTEQQHALFEYDLQTLTSRQVCPHTAHALVFDWAPDNKRLVCLLGSHNGGAETDGIWIGEPAAMDWWHVPKSGELAAGDMGSLLDSLKATRPVWAPEGRRFVFVTGRPAHDGEPGAHTIHLANPATLTVQTVARGPQPCRDIHWRPDGSRLGYVRGSPDGTLCLSDPAGEEVRTLDVSSVRTFAGWDAEGRQFAIVTSGPRRETRSQWVFLFSADPAAREAVQVAADADVVQPRPAFSGMQMTFPHWAPRKAMLSLWATFPPAYRSHVSRLLDLGTDPNAPLRGLVLRPGDPAVLLDPSTGELSWKAINAHERTQIGHYCLLQCRYADAWRWYEQAGANEAKRPAVPPRQSIERFLRGDAAFFHSYCLSKLGREEEAASRRREFEETFLKAFLAAFAPPAAGQQTPTLWGIANFQPTRERILRWRDLYEGEVFLALDAVEDGEAFFRAGLREAKSDADRLSKALLLTQFLLLRQKHQEYADLATDTILPLLLPEWKQGSAGQQQGDQTLNVISQLLSYGDGLSLLPLCAPEFLASLPRQQVRELIPRWQKLRATAADDVSRLVIDLFLQAAAQHLGHAEEQQEAARRLAANPARTVILGEKSLIEFIASIRALPEMFEAMNNFFVTPR